MSGPNVADWQYLGVDKFTRCLEWNYERAVRFSSNREDGSVKTHLHTSPIVVKITATKSKQLVPGIHGKNWSRRCLESSTCRNITCT